MKVNQILKEMPISRFHTIGDFNRNSSFRDPVDRRLITNPKSVQKIKNAFSKTDVEFDLYFVNLPEAGKHTEVGMVNDNWLQENLPTVYKELEQLDAVESPAIKIIFTNNNGDKRKMMNSWTIAHRIGHAFFSERSNIRGSAIRYVSFIM